MLDGLRDEAVVEKALRTGLEFMDQVKVEKAKVDAAKLETPTKLPSTGPSHSLAGKPPLPPGV